jgi:hypothetical protein
MGNVCALIEVHVYFQWKVREQYCSMRVCMCSDGSACIALMKCVLLTVRVCVCSDEVRVCSDEVRVLL